MENLMPLLILGGVVLFIVTIINPFSVLPIFIVGSFVEPMQFFPDLRQYNPTTIVGLMLMAALIFHTIIFRDFAPTKSKQVKYAFLFVVWAFIASFININEIGGLGPLLIFIRVIIPYFLFVYMVKTPKQISIILWILVILGMIAAIYGIYQLKSNIGVYDRGVKRITSFFDNPNSFGFSSLLLIPIALGLLKCRYPATAKIILISAIPLLITGVIISYSRKCAVGIPLVAFLFVWKFFKGGKKFFAFAAVILILIITAYFFPSNAKYRLWSRLRTIGRAESAQDLDFGRVASAKAAFNMTLRNPLFGIGIGGHSGSEYANEFMKIASSMGADSFTINDVLPPHNLYLQVSSQIGLIGLLIYFCIFLCAFKDLYFAEKIFSGKNNYLAVFSSTLQVYIILFL